MNTKDRLEQLTKKLAIKQNQSLDQVSNLRLDIDAIQSELRNLMNTIQIVGNSQFTEHVILDEDIMTHPKNRQSSLVATDPKLDFFSILTKAVDLIPPDIDYDTDTPPHVPSPPLEIASQNIPCEKSPPTSIIPAVGGPPTTIPTSTAGDSASKPSKATDRDRIASILKRYSLYDDDDEEEEDEEEDDADEDENGKN